MMNVTEIIQNANALREKLHRIPEASGCEIRTKAMLMQYLAQAVKQHENDATAGEIRNELEDCGRFFYFVHREKDAGRTLAFRADMDAVMGPDGSLYHGCGHDGHASVMAAIARACCGEKNGKNLIFLFQHAEETGEGAQECLSVFDRETIDAMLAFHNIPGYPEGCVMEKEGTFACASQGLTIILRGKQSHAAYPELGRNPVYVLGALIEKLGEITAEDHYRGMTLLTPVYLNAGAKAFGVSAGSGCISFTLRAWYDEDLKRLKKDLMDQTVKLAEKADLQVSFEECDVFAAAANDPGVLQMVKSAAAAAQLKEYVMEQPMRWSEDFGRFSAGCRTCMVGIGAGTDSPGLHTPLYHWNPAVTETAVKLFTGMICPGCGGSGMRTGYQV